MHLQSHPQYLSGVPWPLWWQAARERKSRRRVRAPTTIPRNLCSGSLLTHHRPPSSSTENPQLSKGFISHAQLGRGPITSALQMPIPTFPINIYPWPGLYSSSRLQPICLMHPANCHLTNLLKPQLTYDKIKVISR